MERFQGDSQKQIENKKIEEKQAEIKRAKLVAEDFHKTSQQEFDKLLVYISGGALVLTIGFVKDIVVLKVADHISCLTLSWIFFTSALLLSLSSHLASVKTMEILLSPNPRKAIVWNKSGGVINMISCFCLLFGICLFVVFVTINIPQHAK